MNHPSYGYPNLNAANLAMGQAGPVPDLSNEVGRRGIGGVATYAEQAQQREREVSAMAARLQGGLEYLDQQIQGLTKQLEPVLATHPQKDVASSAKAVPACTTPLGSRIADFAQHVHVLTEHVSELRQRLEV